MRRCQRKGDLHWENGRMDSWLSLNVCFFVILHRWKIHDTLLAQHCLQCSHSISGLFNPFQWCKNFVFFLEKIGKNMICKLCSISGPSWPPIDWDNGHFAQYRRLQMFKCLSGDRPLNYSGQVSAQFSLNWILGAAAIEYWKKTVIHLIKTWFLFDINWLITLTEYWG